jgi:arginine:ornithine antiporter/lysine permease
MLAMGRCLTAMSAPERGISVAAFIRDCRSDDECDRPPGGGNMVTLAAPISKVTGAMPVAAAAQHKLGLGALTAMVIGSMIGSGVFSLPQNMAAGAGPLAILIGWGITGVGILAFAFVYKSLAIRQPSLDAGPYAYAKAGFGPFIGFASAWGYWISVSVGNVSYAVVMFSAMSYFFPVFGAGNSWQAILGASVVLWVIHALILSGMRTAALVNLVTTIIKIVPILLFIAAAIVAFKVDVFTLDFSGAASVGLGSVLTQVKSTMLVTLWVFIGIEGASVISGRAARRQDVGTATMLGFFICLAIYALVSLLSLGILSQPELAALKNPSMAGVLEQVVGRWGAIVINITLVISVLGAFLSWMILAAEVPHVAARDGTMPKWFGGENANGAPAASLWITSGLVQILLVVTLFASGDYSALFRIAATAMLIPYIFSFAFAAKQAFAGTGYAPGDTRRRDTVIASIATAYSLWLVYAAGATYVLMAAILYAPGIIVHIIARRERRERLFSPLEALVALLIVGAAITAILMLRSGGLSLHG